MRLSVSLGAILLALLAASPAHAQSQISITSDSNDIVVQPDGNSTNTTDIVIHFGTDAAARAQAQQSLTYSPMLERLDILAAETLKTDGRVLPVMLDSIQERLTPAASGAQSFDDRRNKIVIFPDVATGDSIHLRTRRSSLRTLFPGHFMQTLLLSHDFTFDAFEATITVPLAMRLNTDTQGIDLDTHEQDGKRVYRFHREHVPFDVVVRSLSPYDTAPHAFASSFADWGQFAEAYAGLALPKAAVTPEVQALADQITHGVTDRREQARLIYSWVSRNIRYVNVILGIGGMEPHPANTVLINRYGDCKDHTVLFTALLAARGIASEMVVINYGNGYALSDVPTGAQQNHMISYLPEFGLYTDTTSEGLPFGTLAFAQSGKPVVHIASSGAVRRTTPLLTEEDATSALRTTASLRPDGVIIGTSITTATGAQALDLRIQAKQFQAGGSKSVIERMRVIGEPGTGSVIRNDPATQDPSFTLIGNFTLDARPEYFDGAPFTLPTGVRALARPGDYLLGRLFDRSVGAGESIPCWSGRQTEDIALTLPEGQSIERLPKPVDLDGEGIVYHASWTQQGNHVTAHRELHSHMTTPVCDAAKRARMAPLMDKIRASLTRAVLLAETP